MKKNKLIMSLMLAVAVIALPLTLLSSNKATDKKTIVLTSKNTLVLNDEVSDASVSDIITQARELDKKSGRFGIGKNSDPIYLFLYTPGGSIQAGLELSEALHGLNRPVDTITLFAASMGFQLCQDLGQRNIMKNGTLMSHKAYGGFEGEFGGSSSQLQSRMDFWKGRMDEMDKATVARTSGKQTLESYQAAYDNELWRTGTAAVAEGYADRVVNVRCDSSLVGVDTHKVSFMGMTFYYDTDKCPLDTSIKNVRMGVRTTSGEVMVSSFEAMGGGFGSTCFQEQVNNKAKVCALDSTLTPEKLVEIKAKFMNSRSHPSKRIGLEAAPGLRW